MGPKKGKRERKIEVSIDSVPECELGGTTADIQWRKEEREARKSVEEAQKQREEARRNEATHSPEEGVSEKHGRTDKSDTEMDKCNREWSCKTRLMSISKTKQGIFERGLPTVTTCLSRCARPGLSRKGHITASSPNESLDRPEKR